MPTINNANGIRPQDFNTDGFEAPASNPATRGYGSGSSFQGAQLPAALRQQIAGLKQQLVREQGEARDAKGVLADAQKVVDSADAAKPWYSWVPFTAQDEKKALADAETVRDGAQATASKEQGDVDALNRQIDTLVSNYLRGLPGSRFGKLEADRHSAHLLLDRVGSSRDHVSRAISRLDNAISDHQMDNMMDMANSRNNRNDGYSFTDMSASMSTSDAQAAVERAKGSLSGLQHALAGYAGVAGSVSGVGDIDVGNDMFDFLMNDSFFMGMSKVNELQNAKGRMQQVMGQLDGIKAQVSAQYQGADQQIRSAIDRVRNAV